MTEEAPTQVDKRGFWTLGRIVVLVLAILVIALAIANYTPVTLNLLLRTFEIQLTWLILGSLVDRVSRRLAGSRQRPQEEPREAQPMTTTTAAQPRRVLADLVPGGLVRDIALVIGAAALVGITAQIAIPLPFTPVPITLQTFAVLLAGAALGPMRGVASMLVYLAIGAAGVPWFAQQNSGWAFPTFGYILGFVLAAGLTGALARRGLDRTVLGTIGLMTLGNLVIYAVGVPYLAAAIGVVSGRGDRPRHDAIPRWRMR